jgi:hypothetical protein
VSSARGYDSLLGAPLGEYGPDHSRETETGQLAKSSAPTTEVLASHCVTTGLTRALADE